MVASLGVILRTNTNTGDPTLGSQGNIDNKCSDILRFCTPPADVSGPLTTKNIQERNQSPLRRADLEKWLNDVEEFRRKGKEPYNATLLESSDAENRKSSQRLLAHTGEKVTDFLVTEKCAHHYKKVYNC